MILTLILWLNILQGFCSLPDHMAVIRNPLEGYSVQVNNQNRSVDLVNDSTEGSKEDYEDTVDDNNDDTDSSCINKDLISAIQTNLPKDVIHIFNYQDRLSQAHLCPIHTPPDTHTKS